MEVFTKVNKGNESFLVRLDKYLDDSPENWTIAIGVAAVITVISIITMLIKWV